MFTDVFGGAPHARVFDFLAQEAERDHTIMEIARGSGVARPTVYKVIDDFTENELVVETRTLGNSRFFQLDLSNPTVRSLYQVVKPAEFADFELADHEGPRRGTAKRKPRSR